MIVPAVWQRRACPVTALPITTPADLDIAEQWLHAHRARLGRLGDVLVVYGDGTRMPLRVGDWLVHDQGGGFEVWDHARFVAQHERRAA